MTKKELALLSDKTINDLCLAFKDKCIECGSEELLEFKICFEGNWYEDNLCEECLEEKIGN